ncbi:MAG: ShlB/FhaC/HecB family hemolysin secretion/activation protein [Azospirillaceae bacterium]|nr:ShlB/FhaC/HecB family hemolysin secretion/activation protein [Azospirillaceae bacterium]
MLVCAAASLSGGQALAQQTPDAGSILRDTERTTPKLAPRPEPTQPLLPEPEGPSLKAEGQTVRVTAFHIAATVFPEAALQGVLKPYLDRDLTLGDLQNAAAAISAYYRAHGYLARAYLPKQEIKDGNVAITVLESHLGRVVVDPSSESRLDPETASAYLLDRQAAGDPLRTDALEQGIATLNALPGLAATATVEAGEAAEQTDIRLKLKDGPLVSGLALVDNEAQRASGGWRGIAILSANDLAGIGDQTTLTGMRSLGTNYGRLAATMPVGYSGLRLGLNGAGFNYRVSSDFNSSTPDGWGATGGATATLPLLRSQDAAIDGRLTYDHKRLVNRVAGVVSSISVIDVATLGAGGVVKDGWGGVDQVDIAVSGGNLDLGGVPDNDSTDKATVRTGGGYAKLTANFSHQHPLGDGWAAVLRLSGQWASGNLDSSERFALGGPDAVRAYAVNEGQGSEGAVGTLELQWRPVDSLRLAAFWDGGWIRQFTTTWAGWNQGGGEPNSYGLEGFGATITWTPLDELSLDATVAHVVGDNPGRLPDASGERLDSDGLHRRTRAWVRATFSF